jgi:hypothetical protein
LFVGHGGLGLFRRGSAHRGHYPVQRDCQGRSLSRDAPCPFSSLTRCESPDASPKSKSGRRFKPPALLLDKCAITVRLMVRQACPEPRSIAACLGHRRFRLAVYPQRLGRTNRSTCVSRPHATIYTPYLSSSARSGGGCSPTAYSIRRRLTNPGLFKCSVSTVARPIGVIPIMSVQSSFHAKCSAHC